MNCKEVENKLVFFIESDLKPEESVNLNLHLQGCKNCEYLYNQLKASLEWIQNDKHQEINPFFATRVMEGFRKEKQNSIFNWFKLKEYSLQVSVYSLVVVLAIFVGHYLGKDKVGIDPLVVSQQIEDVDNQLFAESYQLQYSDEVVYLIGSEENAE